MRDWRKLLTEERVQGKLDFEKLPTELRTDLTIANYLGILCLDKNGAHTQISRTLEEQLINGVYRVGNKIIKISEIPSWRDIRSHFEGNGYNNQNAEGFFYKIQEILRMYLQAPEISLTYSEITGITRDHFLVPDEMIRSGVITLNSKQKTTPPPEMKFRLAKGIQKLL